MEFLFELPCRFADSKGKEIAVYTGTKKSAMKAQAKIATAIKERRLPKSVGEAYVQSIEHAENGGRRTGKYLNAIPDVRGDDLDKYLKDNDSTRRFLRAIDSYNPEKESAEQEARNRFIDSLEKELSAPDANEEAMLKSLELKENIERLKTAAYLLKEQMTSLKKQRALISKMRRQDKKAA